MNGAILKRPSLWQALTGLVAAVAVGFGILWGVQRRKAPASTPSPATAPADPHAGHTLPAPPGERAVSGRTTVEVDARQLAAIGVRLTEVQPANVAEPVRGVASVIVDESRVSHVHTRVSGWIETLYISTTGERVKAGQPLAEIFSQQLLASQNEYLLLARGGASPELLASARTRLEVLGLSARDVAELERGGHARRTITVVAPRSGVVLHRGISVGTAIDPSTELITVADLSTVWVVAELPEGASELAVAGTPATLSFPVSGLPPIEAKVAFVHPTLSEETRTLRVRFVVANRGGRLKPGLYGSAEMRVAPHRTLTIPRDAVVDTGEEQHVFVASGPNAFAPRRVRLGARVGDRVEVVDGLTAGERIVASGVFLIDSESRLRASGTAGGHAGHGGP
jgi:membrane fusion protein, copper/silver efflux system